MNHIEIITQFSKFISIKHDKEVLDLIKFNYDNNIKLIINNSYDYFIATC